MKRGFTTVEILIALTVIGIIFALVIPQTMNNHQEKVMTLSIEKSYSDLVQNIELFSADNYDKKFENTDLAKNPENFLRNYYKLNKDCGGEPQPCFAEKYSSIDNPEVESNFNCSGGYSIQAKDDSAICIIKGSEKSTIYIDVNGPKVPNIGGRDMYMFYIYNNYYTGDKDNSTDNCTTSKFGKGCLERLIDNKWKMNY